MRRVASIVVFALASVGAGCGGAPALTDGVLSLGPTTYTLAYTSAKFRDKNPKLYQAVYNALTEATGRVNADIRSAARYWIEDSESKLSVDFVAAAGSGKDVKWTMTPESTLKQAEFMVDVGTIKVKPKSWKEYFFPEAYGLSGS